MIKTISVDCSGTDLGTVTGELTKRHLMSFAAALNATQDHYMDDTRAGGIVGLPAMIVRPEWQVIDSDTCRHALGLTREQMWSCIHVTQDSRFFNVFKPGMSLTTTGLIGQIKPTRIGAYVAIRLQTLETDTNEPVAESWFCGIVLGYFASGEAKTVIAPPVLQKVPPQHFDMSPALLVEVTRVLPHLYTEAAAIWNPIHTEKQTALKAGLADILLHGTYAWAAAGHYLIEHCADGQPEKLMRLAGHMANKVLVGSRLSIQFKQSLESSRSARQNEIAFQVIDQNNLPVIADGIAYFNR